MNKVIVLVQRIRLVEPNSQCLGLMGLVWGNLERNLRKYDRDRDYPVETVGITGLRENSGRDAGIEERYWGPSKPSARGAFHIYLILLICFLPKIFTEFAITGMEFGEKTFKILQFMITLVLVLQGFFFRNVKNEAWIIF